MTEKIAFIPARKNSKRLPNKNTRLFSGKPLTWWTLEYARSLNQFDRIILSTDDERVAALADDDISMLKRKDSLAKDDVTLMEVIWNLCEQEGFSDETILTLLMPTGPLRVKSDFSECLKLFKDNNRKGTTFTINVNPHSPGIIWEKDGDKLAPYIKTRTQKDTQKHRHKSTYYFNDLILLDSVANFTDKTRDLFGHHPIGVITPDQRGMPIDTLIQFELAEKLFPPVDERNS